MGLTFSRIQHSPIQVALGVFFLALIPRILFVILGGPNSWDWIQNGAEMGSVARNVALGNGFTGGVYGADQVATAWFCPLVPLIWAAHFLVLGSESNLALRFLLLEDAVVYSAACVAYVFIVQTVVSRNEGRFSPGVRKHLPLWTGIICALLPEFITVIAHPWYTAYQELFSALVILCAISWVDVPTNARAVRTGFVTGALALINPTFLPWFLTVAFEQLARIRRGLLSLSKFLAQGVLFVAILLIMLSPWIVRNALVFERFIPTRATFGIVLNLGNNPRAVARLTPAAILPNVDAQERERYLALGESKYDQESLDRAIEFIRGNPLRFAQLTAERFFLFWFGDLFEVYPWDASDHLAQKEGARWAWRLYRLVRPALCSALLFGLLFTGVFRGIKGIHYLLGVLLFYPLPYYITTVEVSYVALVQPYILMLLILALGQWWSKAKTHQR